MFLVDEVKTESGGGGGGLIFISMKRCVHGKQSTRVIPCGWMLSIVGTGKRSGQTEYFTYV